MSAFALGPVGFAHPGLLLALLALPILWVLLRAVPPAPLRKRFPAVALLLGLSDDDSTSARTPWWLLLLRAAALAALIVGLAGPVLNPDAPDAAGEGPLLVLVDATWADAPRWDQARADARAALEAAGRAGRPVALLRASGGDAPGFTPARAALERIAGLAPQPWGIVAELPLPEGDFTTLWISDGVDWPARADLTARLQARGPLRVIEPPARAAAITDVTRTGDGVRVAVSALDPRPRHLRAIGPDPSGTERVLAEAPVTDGTAQLALPAELRNRLTRLVLDGPPGAGATWLTGASLKRPRVALIAGRVEREAADLLSPLHYLRQALAPHADPIPGTLLEALDAGAEVIVLADVARLAEIEQTRLQDWMQAGGLLIRFAGPAMAQAGAGDPVAGGGTDPLLPVPLRRGGRSIGGALSWDSPRTLAPFGADSPFHGLALPGDVVVHRQVLAEPGPDLEGHVIARLEDGTPLVTRRGVGAGQVVLFHVTANAEWSGLPLSGLFVEMLARLLASAGPGAAPETDLAGRWQLAQALDGFGALQDPPAMAGIDGARLAMDPPGPDLPPGLWRSDARIAAVNAGRALRPATWPAAVPVTRGEAPPARPLGGGVLALALLALAVDVAASLAVAGRLAAVVLALALLTPGAEAQDSDARAIEAAAEVHLAYVTTGDASVDEISRAGLYGLSNTLYRRTAIEPGLPMAVDIETDELAFFPLLYWPVTADQPLPSAQAVERLNRYLRSGGMIVFDTRDADLPDAVSPATRRLRAIAAPLAVPALEPLPDDHVLTRSFYLLSRFPGRHADGPVWVEASARAAEVEGQPFRDRGDGVTPVVIGSADWAGAWATDQAGNPLLPVGRGLAGEQQREMALRFGVNLVMHVLTGNYKSDQVHVPALLDRLGEGGK